MFDLRFPQLLPVSLFAPDRKERRCIRVSKSWSRETDRGAYGAFKHVKEKDLIYFDKAAAHKIEIDKEPYHVIKQENVVVVL